MGDDGGGKQDLKPGAHSITGGLSSAGVAAPSKDLAPGKETPTSKLDVGQGAPSDQRDLATGRTALEALDTARTLAPAYQRAVNALDGLAAAELAHNLLGALQIAETGKQRVIEACAAAKQARNDLLGLKQRLTAELAALEGELAIKLGPQQLDGAAVMGNVIPPQLGDNPLAYLLYESSVTVELLGVVAQVKHATGAQIGACPKPSPATEQVVIYLVEPWRSRPVNFAFLVAALRKLHVWDEVAGVKSKIHGKSLADTEQKVGAQAKETGALADVGDLDTEGLTALLREAPPGTPGARPGGQWIDDRAAQKIFERLAAASPAARGPLVQQIARMGKLNKVCDHVPKQALQALHDAIQPFDPVSATMLVPFFAKQGGEGRSMHKIYEDKIMGDLHDGKNVRAYLWTFLDVAHNALTMGFQHDYSQAYDAHEAGQITDDAFTSSGGKALGKAGAIGLLSTVTGGAAGAFGEGFAAGLGASESIASIIGAGVGGFGAGVGGHLAGDVFDQAFNGKQGFDSLGAYMQSGAAGGIMGTILGGISVGAGKYLNKSGGARPIDQLASRYPQNAGILERLRTAGFGAGAETRATAIKLKVTAAELADMLASGLIGPQPAFATAIGGLPPRAQLELSVRPQPMQMSAAKPPPGSNALPGSHGGTKPDSIGKSDAEPKLEIEEIKPLETKLTEPAKPKAEEHHKPDETHKPDEAHKPDEKPHLETKPKLDPPSDAAKPRTPRSGDIHADEREHFDKGHFAEEGKLTGGGHGHTNIAELERRGYDELSPAEVAQLRSEEQAYLAARKAHLDREMARNEWDNKREAFSASTKSGLPNAKQLAKLNDPRLPPEERARLEATKAAYDAAMNQWKIENPAPPRAGRIPKPEEFGLPSNYKTLPERRYYYQEPLGKTGAKIGGVSSPERAHTTGHTWFPPGWEAKPLFEILEAKGPGVSEAFVEQGELKAAVRRTAWIRKTPDGQYEVAPPGLKDPQAEGYLKTSMITPLDGAQRTVFAEMKQ